MAPIRVGTLHLSISGIGPGPSQVELRWAPWGKRPHPEAAPLFIMRCMILGGAKGVATRKVGREEQAWIWSHVLGRFADECAQLLRDTGVPEALAIPVRGASGPGQHSKEIPGHGAGSSPEDANL